nr:hypothetical protein [Tanacetum cinerariifolium]
GIVVIPSTSVISLESSAIAHVISSTAPVVETTIVASPTGLCGLVPYSDLDSDSPNEMASPEVTTHSSSPSDFPIAPVTPSPRTRRRAAILIRPEEAIPLGRPYCTHPNGPWRVMTARKQVGPLPAHGLAWRRVSPRSSYHCPSSSSFPADSSPVHSLGLDAPASAIAISFDSSDESVGSPRSQVIHFGDIPIVIPSTSVISLESSAIAHVISSTAPVVETTIIASPTGLCGLVPYSDLDSDSPDEMASPEVTTHSSSPSDFPIAPITPSPRTRRRAAILILPEEAIPLGRPYCTHPNGPWRVMTARKRVGPLPAHGLAWRRVSPRSSYHCPSSSSLPADSSPVHSLVTRSLAPTHADLIPPRKRFKDSYLSETSMEEDTEIDTTKTEDGRGLDIV